MSTKAKKSVADDVAADKAEARSELRKANFLEKTCDFSERFEKNGPEFDPSHMQSAFNYMDEETRETKEAYGKLSESDQDPEAPSKDAEEVLDGFLDTAFVSLAGAYKFFRLHGHNAAESQKRVNEAMLRVCNANLKKEHPTDGIVRNDVGKVQKPEGWQEPRFADLLKSPAAAKAEVERKVGADRNSNEEAA